ncbi:hypothetical protein NUW54_g648 [Trametes sanguinea]|uniref:Uncharacterized protein n=1 Tax=Trametes sanguinea TaxID=158606 RepID=A0ACC1Q8L4_9APHY|nr:hypothetical protein NUW54_g648 [Trametes sanguinea]
MRLPKPREKPSRKGKGSSKGDDKKQEKSGTKKVLVTEEANRDSDDDLDSCSFTYTLTGEPNKVALTIISADAWLADIGTTVHIACNHANFSYVVTPGQMLCGAGSAPILVPARLIGKKTWDKWHHIFRHISMKSIMALKKHNMVASMTVNESKSPSEQCEAYIQAKHTTAPFPKKSETETAQIGDLTVMDLCGPASVREIRGKHYFVMFTDAKACFSEMTFCKYKSEAPTLFKAYKASPTCAPVGITPVKAWTGKKPDIANLQEWGAKCWVLISQIKQTKLNLKSHMMHFFEMADGSKAWKYYNPTSQCIGKLQNLVFAIPNHTSSSVPEPTEGEYDFVELPAPALLERESSTDGEQATGGDLHPEQPRPSPPVTPNAASVPDAAMRRAL